MCRYSYNRRSSKFFQKLSLMLVVKICSKCADKHKQNVELICRRHIEQSIILILIHRSQLVGIDPIYISAWKNNEVGVALLCAYHCALCNRIVKIIFKLFQIIRCKETIHCVSDSCNCCHCSNNCQYPDHFIFLTFRLFFVQQIIQFCLGDKFFYFAHNLRPFSVLKNSLYFLNIITLTALYYY